jgi:tRNA(His) guanylyltransferase
MTDDAAGNKCKSYESAESERRAMKGIPLLARLDGRAFHTFTKGLTRPFDPNMSMCMIETAKYLVQETVAMVGYTQSDEITLLWHCDANSNSEYFFNGRFQKITSILSAMATAKFLGLVAQHLPSKAHELPLFDCRVWQVPTLQQAAETFIWREDDATKNSITMAAGAYYAHDELEGKSSSDKHEMLFRVGVNWNDYPAFFKRGTYLQRRPYNKSLTNDELAAIPVAYRPTQASVVRYRVEQLDLPPIRSIVDPEATLFRAHY